MVQVAALEERLADDVDAAFPELVRVYQDRLYSGIRSFVGAGDAADVTQETLIRAHRALHRYGPERIRELKMSAWLWTIALNLCRNWARARSRRPEGVQLSFDRAGHGDVEGEAVADLMLETWRRRLDALSAPQRTAVVLRHVVGMSYQEIATVTGRPIGTAKADVSRGLAALRRIVSKEDS